MKNFIVWLGVCVLSFLSVESGQAGSSKEEWKELKTPHFMIYYQKAPFDFVKTVESSAEDYYTDIADGLGFTRYVGWSFDRRARIYIYDDQEHYLSSGRAQAWSAGEANAAAKLIRTYPSAHGFFDSVLPHELAHIILREFLGERAKIPRWFDEGVAMNQEKARRWGSHQEAARALREGTFIPLTDMTDLRFSVMTRREDVELFYSEAASAVSFLLSEYGDQRFVRLCRKLQEGGPFEWALAFVYVRFKGVKEFNDAWVKYLEGNYR